MGRDRGLDRGDDRRRPPPLEPPPRQSRPGSAGNPQTPPRRLLGANPQRRASPLPLLGLALVTLEAAGALRVIGISIVLYSVSRVPAAVLERELRYGRKAVPEVAASFVYAASAVGLAALHFGYWSIILATVIRSTAVSAGLFVAVW